MNLYLITQSVINDYDTYDSAVVSAKSASDAKKIHPCEFVTHVKDNKWMGTFSGGANVGGEYENETSSWVAYRDIDRVDVEFLGKTNKPRGVILASFNAG